jgi:hypothetical protein
MSWKQLLAQHKVQLHTTSKQELDGLRALIERDLTDAALAGLSADRRFATAYNAALQTAKMVIACAGYRVASTPGHHRLHFEAARIALGSNADRFLDYFVSESHSLHRLIGLLGYLKRGSPISSASGNKKPLIRAFALAAISEFP